MLAGLALIKGVRFAAGCWALPVRRIPRAGLTEADEADAYHQLSLLGSTVSPDDAVLMQYRTEQLTEWVNVEGALADLDVGHCVGRSGPGRSLRLGQADLHEGIVAVIPPSPCISSCGSYVRSLNQQLRGLCRRVSVAR